MADIDAELLDVLFTLKAAMERVSRVTRGHDLADMRESELMQLGVTKAVEQVGEISGRILRKFPVFAAAHPEFKLVLAYGARNRFVHGYETLDVEVVWLSATVAVAAMNDELVQFLHSIDDQP